MNGDPWTDEGEQELRQWFANGRSNKEIAELTGRSVWAIERRKHLLGLRSGSATCQRCGAPLIKKNGRPGNYCNQVCAAWSRYEAGIGHLPMVEVKGVCAHCEKPFARTVRPWGPGQLQSAAAAYCSRDCDKAAWYQREKAGPDGQEFMRVRSQRSIERWRRRRKARGPLIPNRPSLYLPWTEQEDRLLKQMYSGAVTYKVIAVALGRSTAAVGNRLVCLKIPRRSKVRNV
jgi:hypothetical protein